MKGLLLLVLLLEPGTPCFPADGSSSQPYHVLTSSSAAPGTGSSCDPFSSLATALLVSSLESVTISLQSAAAFPAGTVSQALSIVGNWYELNIEGSVRIEGALVISAAKVTCTVSTDFVLQVFGSLSLQSCTLSDFVSTPISVTGQVNVSDSTIKDNLKGVFSVLAFGAELTVTEATFLRNAAPVGAVFFIYPASGSSSSRITALSCHFQDNAAPSGGSVLLANDLGAPPTTATHTILFTGCDFQGHSSLTFQVLISHFTLSIENSQFEREAQIVAGVLTMTNVTISSIAVTRCVGPPLSFQMAGTLEVTDSNFTDVSAGPMLAVMGSGVSTALVRVQQVRLLRFTNMGTVIYGNLLTALSATVWLEDVELRNFTAAAFGVLYLVDVALFTNKMAIYDGNVVQNVIGLTLLSSFSMVSTLFDNINSYGTMWTIAASAGTMTHLTYRNIMGLWDEKYQLYTVNYFLASEAQVTVDDFEAFQVHPGIALLYGFYASVSVANSRFGGVLGLDLMTIQGGSAVFRNTTLAYANGLTVFVMILGGSLDYDSFALVDTILTLAIIKISSGSKVQIGELSMTNVTSTALCNGQDYELNIDKSLITQSHVHSLVYFSIGV